MIRSIPINNCVSCGQKVGKPLFKSFDRLHGIGGEYFYVKCSKCGLLYQAPQVSKEDIFKLYPETYDPHRSRNVSNKSKVKWRDYFIHFARTHFINRIKGIKIKPAVFNKINESSKVLDVGCGAGDFLYNLKRITGCQAFGIDMSANAVKTAKMDYNLEIAHGCLEEMNYPAGSFDLITAWFYLEHVPDPDAVLKEMERILKKDGDIILGVPNSKSFNAFVFRNYWFHLDSPRHFHLWTTETLSNVLTRNNLSIDKAVFDKSPWGLIGSLRYLMFGKNFTSGYKNLILRNPVVYLLLLPWTILLGLLKRSDIAIYYCKKI